MGPIPPRPKGRGFLGGIYEECKKEAAVRQPRKGDDIRQRALKFGLRILRLAGALKRTGPSRIIADQIVRSGTSIGANLAESEAAFTKADFRYLVNVARKEACETRYWLSLLAQSELLPNTRLNSLMGENEELIKILSAIVKRSGSSKKAR